MMTLVLVLLVVAVILMIILILLQKSEGGGFTSSMTGSVVSSRSFSNILTKGTSFLATIFFVLSIILAIMTKTETKRRKSILDQEKISSLVKEYNEDKKSSGNNQKTTNLLKDKAPDIKTNKTQKEEKSNQGK